MSTIFYGNFRLEKCGSEDCSKIAKFWEKQRGMDIVQEMLTKFNDCPELGKIWCRIMGVWLSHWNQSPIIPMEVSRRANTEKSTSSSIKYEGFTHCFLRLQWREFLPQGRTVNKEYYLEVMSRLCEIIRQKRIELWINQTWTLHHDNAQGHTSMLVREFLTKNKTVIMPQPPYSLDLDPADFFSFSLRKTEDTDERKAFCYDWGDKGKIETEPVGDTKNVSRIGKNAGISVLYL